MSFPGTQSFSADGQARIESIGQNHVGFVSHGNDKGLWAEFFTIDEYKPYKSVVEGRAIYEQIEMVKIFAPGAKTDIIQRVKYVDDVDGPAHVNRFPAQYKAFKNQQEQVPEGTGLEFCKFMASHRVKELKAQGIHTAEQMAQVPDSILQTLGMGSARERELCRTYIGNDDEKTRQVSRVLAENESMKMQMDTMRQQMEELNRLMAGRLANEGRIYQSTLEQTISVEPRAPLPGEIFEEAPLPEPKRGPGRPRKEAA